MMMAPLSPLFLFIASRNSSPIGRQRILGTVVQRMSSSSSGNGFQKSSNQHKPSPMAGMPISPEFKTEGNEQSIILRYMYEGGAIGQGRLCNFVPDDSQITARQIVQKLSEDGVDFDSFYACAYESDESSGGWMPLESAPRYTNQFTEINSISEDDQSIVFQIPSSENAEIAPRIDLKLFRRPKVPSELRETVDTIDTLDINKLCLEQDETNTDNVIEHSSDALMAISAAVPGGKQDINGYFGIGILSPKTEQNVGTLWRSAYQLGASMLYTIGGRYKTSSSDTLNVPARIPLIELDNWNNFVESAAPKSAVWVAIEMGGTPLSEFKHPRNAIYILGSEDHGVPKSVLRGCREIVSLESETYGSYNVAVAGSLVMYDRMMKMKQAASQKKNKDKSKR